LILKTCLACGGSSLVELYRTTTSTFNNTAFDLLKCDECGLILASPQPSADELTEYYSNYDATYATQWQHGEQTFNKSVCKTILKYKKDGSILDVGCGYGLFLKQMRECGFDVMGIEQVPGAVEFIESNMKLPVFHGTAEAFFCLRSRKYDVISYLNVLEHVRNPKLLLTSAFEALSTDGLLVLCVPDSQVQLAIGRLRKRLGCKDPFLMSHRRVAMVAIGPPHHLTSFTPKSIRRLLELVGFEIVSNKPAPAVCGPGITLKNELKKVSKAFSVLVNAITLGRYQFGYSMLVIARKRETTC